MLFLLFEELTPVLVCFLILLLGKVSSGIIWMKSELIKDLFSLWVGFFCWAIGFVSSIMLVLMLCEVLLSLLSRFLKNMSLIEGEGFLCSGDRESKLNL